MVTYDRNSLLELVEQLMYAHLYPVISDRGQTYAEPYRVQAGYDRVQVV